jgi:Ca2+-binding RTX toxin-like protein
MRSRCLALLCSLALLSSLAIVGSATSVGAGTSQRQVVVNCSFAPVQPTPTPRTFGVTLTTPDSVVAGSPFTAAVRVQLDQVTVPPGVTLDEFRVISEWRVSGGASPSGDITVTTPTRSYATGDALVYDTVSVPFSAAGPAGSVITYELTHITWELRHAGASYTIGPDCALAGGPISIAATTIVSGGALCLGLPATITGTAGNDTLVGTAGRDVIHAGAGDDVVYGQGGDDVICGGDGGDVLWGGSGNDRLDGGSGQNLLLGGLGADSCTSGIRLTC